MVIKNKKKGGRKMNKIKKIASSILVGILAIIGVNSVSNAYYVGQELTVHYSDYASSSNIFCMEYGQALTYDNDYKIISQVTIEGTKSTDYENKIINHKDNAKFAYILSADNGNVKDYGPVAKEIWDFGPNWMKNVGQYHNGLYLGFSGSSFKE